VPRLCRKTLVLVIVHSLAGCAGGLTPVAPTASAPMPVAMAPPAPPPAMPWPVGRDCRATLAAVASLAEPARRRLEPTAAPLTITVLDHGIELATAAAGEAVLWDLPVPIEDGGTASCAVLVDRTPTARAAPRRILAHQLVRSTYRRGSRSTTNPEQAALRRSMRELEQEDGVQVLATGEPSVDLIGLLVGGILDGISRYRRGRAETQARDELAATPATLEEVIWEPYTYELTELEATRTGVLRAALVDRRLGRAWPIGREVRETRRFAVAAGRSPKDRPLLESASSDVVSRADVAVWEQAGLQPSLTQLLATLSDATGDGVRLEATEIAAGWAAAPIRLTNAPMGSPDVEPAEPSRQHADGSTALRPRGSSVEQTVTADGLRSYRLVTPADEPMAAAP
jgi:hypothetical protein